MSGSTVDITAVSCSYFLGLPIRLRYFALCTLTIQTTAAVILTRYSKAFPSDAPYFSSSLVVTTEVMKLALSLILVFVFDTIPAKSASDGCGEGAGSSSSNGVCGEGPSRRIAVASPTTASVALADMSNDPAKDYCSSSGSSFAHRWVVMKAQLVQQNFAQPLDTVKLAVPALLYTIQNNLIYVALAHLEATTFQVGYQSKVITTAIMSVLLLNRSLSRLKWAALVLLTIGIILTQIPEASSTSNAVGAVVSDKLQSPFFGIIAVLSAATCSAFAGVYFEKILKGTNPSVWMRNAQLASFSAIIGMFMFLYVEGAAAGFFQGYNELVWAIILVQAGGGLIIAVVMKYADNILKGFATAISIILCGVLSALFMGFVPGRYFLFGSAIVIGATFMYSL